MAPSLEEAPAVPSSQALPEEIGVVETLPYDARVPTEEDGPDRWLFVEKVRDGVSGGWATGSFDPKRNKLTIRERDVQRFAIDVGRIPVDWERLVVIGINGRNSELRKRDYSVLHFALDEHGQWKVIEP